MHQDVSGENTCLCSIFKGALVDLEKLQVLSNRDFLDNGLQLIKALLTAVEVLMVGAL